VSVQGHIEALKTKHSHLDALITAEDLRPRPDADALHRLKVEKLHLKEELDRLGPSH
jgi:hypothetical protein